MNIWEVSFHLSFPAHPGLHGNRILRFEQPFMVNQAILTQGTPGVEILKWWLKQILETSGEYDWNMSIISRWWFQISNIFCFRPYLGKIPILTNIFQRGGNHQPDIVWIHFCWYRYTELPPRRACHWSLKPMHNFFRYSTERYTFGGSGAWNCGNWSQWDGSCNCVTRRLAFSEVKFISWAWWSWEHLWWYIPSTSWVGWNMLCKVFFETSFHYFYNLLWGMRRVFLASVVCWSQGAEVVPRSVAPQWPSAWCYQWMAPPLQCHGKS